MLSRPVKGAGDEIAERRNSGVLPQWLRLLIDTCFRSVVADVFVMGSASPNSSLPGSGSNKDLAVEA